MSTIVRQLRAIVTAETAQYDAAMTRVETRAAAAAAKLRMAGMVMGGLFAIIGVASVKMAADFEKNMANVNTLLGGNSKRIKELGEDVKRMARDTGKGLDDLTGGLYQVISAFGDSADSVKILDISAKAAVAGLATTTEAINLISAVTKGFGDTSAEAAQKAADLAFVTVKLGQTTFPELAASIGRVVPMASKMGATVEEVNAIFATLTGVTGNAAEVSTQTAALFKAMIKPTEEMKLVIEDLGYSGSEALVGSLGLVPALKAVMGKTDGTVEALGKLIPRGEALTALFALTGGQAEVFAQKLEAMGDASGAATEAFDIQANTFQNRLDRLIQDISTGLVDLGTTLMPMAETILGWAGNIAKFAKEIAKLFETVGKAADEWMPDWLKNITEWEWLGREAGKGWANIMLTAQGIDPRLADPGEAARMNQIWAQRGGAPEQEKFWEQSISWIKGAAEAQKELGDATEDTGDKTDDAAAKIVAYNKRLNEMKEASKPLIATVKNLFDEINKGIEERTIQGLKDWLGFMQQGLDLAITGGQFGGAIDQSMMGQGLLSFFGEDLPAAMTSGWNLYVKPTMIETAEETAARLAKTAEDELRLHVTRGLVTAFSDAFRGEFAFDTFLTQFGRGLKNMFTWIIEDWSQRLAEKLGGVKGELAAMAAVFGGQLLGAMAQQGGIEGVFGSTAQGALAGGLAAGPWGALAGGIAGFVGGLFGMGGETDFAAQSQAIYEAQMAALAQAAQDTADALANAIQTIKDTNWSIYQTKERLDDLRDSLVAARTAEREAARAIGRTGTQFKISTGRPAEFVGFGEGFDIEAEGVKTGGPALKELQRLIDEAIGTGKYGRISRKEKAAILAQVVGGEENEQLAEILIEAAAAVAALDATFTMQKEQLSTLRDTRKAARRARDDLQNIEDAIVKSGDKVTDAIYWLGDQIRPLQSGGDISRTGLYQLHAGERVSNARDTAQMDRGELSTSRGGPTTINLVVDGKVLARTVLPGLEDLIHGRQSRQFSDTIRRRGVK